MPNLKIIKEFPDNFTFGVATSSYQIEGNSFGNSGLSHWDHFSKIKGNVYNNESGKIACAHLPNYKEDIKLIAEAGFSAYRFSFSWPRILPDGKGSINKEGISFYDRLIDELLENNLKTFSTLYHWDLPEIFMSKGGWKNRDTTKWFADFTDIIMRKFSDRLNSIATINEPWCVSWLSHYLGEHAPGERSIESGVKTMHMILVAHAEAMQVIRSHNYNNAGIVLNKQFVQPFDDIPETLKVTNLADEIHNLWFDEAIFNGVYPSQTLDLFSQYMPNNYEKDLVKISQPLDWVGINYYTRSLIKIDPTETFLGYRSVNGDLDVTDMGWEVFPKGLRFLIERFHNKYSKKTLIENYQKILILMSPVIPHFTNECLEIIKVKDKIIWPKYNKDLIQEDEINIVVQVNGKKRDVINTTPNLPEEDLFKLIGENETMKKYLNNQKIKRKIFIKNKLVNIII